MLIKSLLSCITTSIIAYCIYASCIRYCTSHSKESHPFTVVCTTTLIADAVTAIVGDHAQVHTLMGPNIDPHMYRARESDVHTLAQADLIIYHGLHLEGRMIHIMRSMNHYTTTVAATECLPKEQLKLLDVDTHTYDPHVWLSVPLWIQVVQHIGRSIAHADPTHAQEYCNNTQHYCAQLQTLHNDLTKSAAALARDKRILVTAHDAFGYFGDTYDFTVVGLQGISTQAEPSITDVQRVAQFLTDHNVPSMFVESLIPQRTLQAVQHACAARSWHVAIGPQLYSDALSPHNGPASTYCALMRHNMTSIVQALQAPSGTVNRAVSAA